GRIIGGRVVKPHSRPYMAYLKILQGSQTIYCGGFLIHPNAVLSAAHCVKKGGAMNITVLLGAHNIRVQEGSQQRFSVGRLVIHPKYSQDSVENDIVLLQLKTKAKLNENVKTISFSKSKEQVRAGAKCTVSGWGWTSVTGPGSDVMREVELEVQKETICKQRFLRNYQRQSMICAGNEYCEKGFYKGDSGGPLVCNQKAYGIVSFVHKHCLFPEVFTRISYFEPWIQKQLRR
ncbi:MCT1A protease, partial [Sitta europaea]|nr:MCT1A protease [Sitta europaea]